eukprot:TRINITY_DN9723_c0_g1_i1.p1 TRINITY_DN9723_c0_g1~~TRINITY_DN9723_c0_g1_i1.p1  ORF type:complete len:386 (+),score=103.92 TRINITY_DN9723_c0_g1_i1:167-1324(+)
MHKNRKRTSKSDPVSPVSEVTDPSKCNCSSLLPLLAFFLMFFAWTSYRFISTEPPDYSDIGRNASAVVVLHSVESDYGRLAVVEDSSRHFRVLINDAVILGGFYKYPESTEAPVPLFVAFSMQSCLVFTRPNAKRLLQIGLGVGLVASEARTRGVSTTAIESNADVVRLAREYFGYDDSAGATIVGDARDILFDTSGRLTPNGYDFVLHDVFAGGVASPQLMSREVFARIRLHLLVAGGVLAVNVFGFFEGPHFVAGKSVMHAAASEFKERRCFVDSPTFGNMVCFFSDEPFDFDVPEDVRSRYMAKGDHYWVQSHMAEFEQELNFDGVPVLTDATSAEALDVSRRPVGERLWQSLRKVFPRTTLTQVWGRFSDGPQFAEPKDEL